MSSPARVTVGVVAICSEMHLLRCLEALTRQSNAPQFDVVIAAAPRLGKLSRVQQQFSEAQIVADEDLPSPLQLAARALRAARGDVILLTEDHCVPDSGWVRSMVLT